MNSLQDQLSQIDDAESFLKSTFGDVDFDSWDEEDEDNKEANEVADQLVEGEPSEGEPFDEAKLKIEETKE